jgi:putative transposase
LTNLRHYDHLGTARFVTFSCYHRFRLLSDASVIRTFLTELGSLRKLGVKILGYVVMPEHVHLVLLPPDAMQVGLEVGHLKSRSARQMLAILEKSAGGKTYQLWTDRNSKSRRVFWRRRCYDHNCRSPEKTREKIEYCHKNPVTRGLAQEPGDWPWSSYRWYAGLDGVELEIDGCEL